MAAESIVEDVQNTSLTSGVSPIVTNDSGPGNPEFSDTSLPYTELDEATICWLMTYGNPSWQHPN